MEELAREFVRRRDVLRQAGSGFRVPEELRRVAIRFGRWALDEGESLGGVAATLEVSRATLERWLDEEPAFESSPGTDSNSPLDASDGGTLFTVEPSLLWFRRPGA